MIRLCLCAALSGCCCSWGLGDSRPDTERVVTYAAYRGCSRDAGHPELTLPIVHDDGSIFESWGGPSGKHKLRWGRTTRARVRSHYTSISQHWSSSIVAIESEIETPGVEFRMRSCGSPFLGPDARSMLDGRAFTCEEPLCTELDARIAKVPRDRFDLVLRFADAVDDPLILVAVEDRTCDDPLDCWIDQDCCDPGAGEPVCVPEGTCTTTVITE